MIILIVFINSNRDLKGRNMRIPQIYARALLHFFESARF